MLNTQNTVNNKTNKTAHYDGSSWIDSGNFTINIAYHAMEQEHRQQEALLVMYVKFDGSSPDQSSEFFEYNGSSWSAAGNQNNTRYGTDLLIQTGACDGSRRRISISQDIKTKLSLMTEPLSQMKAPWLLALIMCKVVEQPHQD